MTNQRHSELHNKTLDASGGSVFLNLIRPAKGALIPAAASTQPLIWRPAVNHSFNNDES